jgi:hypothetical protein
MIFTNFYACTTSLNLRKFGLIFSYAAYMLGNTIQWLFIIGAKEQLLFGFGLLVVVVF